MSRGCWEMLGRAIEMKVQGATVIAPCIRLELRGEDQVAIAYGGHKGRVDRERVVASVRRHLDDWPFLICDLVIEEDEPRNHRGDPFGERDRIALAAAKAKRARKAARWRAQP